LDRAVKLVKASESAAVAIFLYRRPGLVRGLLDRLRSFRPEKIWIIADGPKSAAERKSCDEARGEAEGGITWPCQVRRIYAETNLGIRERIETGLDQVFAEEEAAIVLEEDCHPGPDFLPFCNEMLARYRHHSGLAGVSGNSYLPVSVSLDSSYFYSRYLQIWGWATWVHVWRAYDRSHSYWPREGYRGLFPQCPPDEEKYWNQVFCRLLSGEIETWDYPLLAFFWSRGWWAVTPTQNLVENKGQGDGATHTSDVNADPGWGRQERLAPPFRGPPVFGGQGQLDREIFLNHYHRMSGRRTLAEKIMQAFQGKLFGRGMARCPGIQKTSFPKIAPE
jgi:hypothetical protein